MKKIRFLILVVFLLISGTALSLPNNARAQEEGPPPIVEIGISEKNRSGAHLEDLNIEINYQDLQQLRFKNFEFELVKERALCVRIVVQYLSYSEKYAVDAYHIPECINWLHVEYMYAPVEVVILGPEYDESVQYFVQAIEARAQETGDGPFFYVGRTEEGFKLLRLGLLHFLKIHFPNKLMYAEQLPTPTPTPTLTPTPTQTSTSTPTPTHTFTPTSTSTSTPTPTSTSTPEPTITPTPTQSTFLNLPNYFINDLQEGRNSYLPVFIVLIIILIIIGIGLIVYFLMKKR